MSTFYISFADSNENSNTTKKSLAIIRRQVNIIPAIAITDYKAQSKTLDKIIIDLREPVTGNSQWCANYVAISRARSIDDILIIDGWDANTINKQPPSALLYFMNTLQTLEKQSKETYDSYEQSMQH